MSDALVKHMASRFLGWKLPSNFQPDGGVTFFPSYNNGTPEGGKHEPVGTNLLTASQAEEMVRYMLDDAPAKEWRAWALPNGVWEVVEWTPESHRTIVRGVLKDQAEAIVREHSAAL